MQREVRTFAESTLGRCHKTVLSDIDDETFLHDGMRLPANGSLCPRLSGRTCHRGGRVCSTQIDDTQMRG